MSADALTVLRTKGSIIATKRISRGDDGWQIAAYDNAAHFSVHEVPVRDLPSLARALGEIERDPQALVIRGNPLPGINRNRTRRLIKATIKRGVTFQPTFAGAARRWLAVDHDDLPVPTWCEKHLARRRAAGGGPDPAPIDPARDWTLVCRTCLAVLPDAFRGISCFWQMTSGAGIRPSIRARLWFWLDRPVDDEQAKIWLKGHPVDMSLYNPIQAHYTAAPIFDPPELDPVPRRSGIFWQLGGDTVRVPEIRKPEPIVVERQPRPPRPAYTDGPNPAQGLMDQYGIATVTGGGMSELRAQRYASACLQYVVRTPQGERHKALRSVAITLFGMAEHGLLDPQETMADLIAAADTLSWPQGRRDDLLVWCAAFAAAKPELPKGFDQ